MLSLENLLHEYPQPLHTKKLDIVREYLQYIFLGSIFTSSHADRLCFIGGTALRLIHNNSRFSEDLDFDNTGLTWEMFEELVHQVESSLKLQGIEADITLSRYEAFHANFKVRYLLTHYGLAPDTRPEVQQKLHVKVDTHDQGYNFVPDITLLGKFGIRSTVAVAPLSLLMSHKILTIGERKRAKGRDYFDLVFLMSKQVKPDYGYLKQFLDITTDTQIKDYLLSTISAKNKDRLIRDVQPFLFNPYDDSIKHFELYVENYTF